MKKRILSLLMALCLIVGLLPTVALAADGSNNDTTSTVKVAAIGDTKYQTLQEAINNAKDNDTVKLLCDVTDGGGVIVAGDSKRTLTIDFGGYTYTVTKDPAGSTGTKTQCFQLLKGSTIKMQNGTINANSEEVYMMIQNYSNLTLDGMTLDAMTGTNSINYVLSNNCGNVVITGKTAITAKANGVAFDVYHWSNEDIYKEGVTVTIDEKMTGSITGKVECSTATGTQTPANVLVIKGGTINGTVDVQNAESVSISNAKVTDGITLADGANASVVVQNSQVGGTISGNVVVLNSTDLDDKPINDKVPEGVVALVNGVRYTTLQAAIDNANAGDTITLLKDITIDATTDINQNSAVFIINKAITLDGNGKSITAGTKFGNTNIINVEDSGDVTIKNLTVNGTANSVSGQNSRHCINIFSSTNTKSKSVVTLENIKTTGGLTGVTIGGSDVMIKGDKTNIATGSWNVAVNLDSNSGVNDASLTVENGTIGNIYIENTSSTPKVKATVTGGTINSLTIKDDARASAEISGGTFTEQPANLTVKEGYIAAKDETTGKFIIRERIPSTLTTNIDQVKFIVGAPTEFTFTTTANDDSGTMVIGTSTFSDTNAIEKLEYYEVKDNTWHEFNGNFGSASGFPMSNATSKFRVTFKTAGTYSFTASMKTADGDKELCKTVVNFTVSEPAPVVPTYSVTVPAVDNGTVTVSPKYATSGRTVTITVKPDDGYELDALTVTDAKGNELELTDKGDGKYTFKMPNSKVTVNATFVEKDPEPVTDPVKDCPKDETCPAAKFEDVKLGEWYHDGVHYCIVEGLMNGTGATTFEPDSTTERAMLVTVLYRLEGKPEVGENTFTDVRENEWYTDAITWAAENKIVEGYGDGLFGPEDSITREQFATILYRYAKYKGYDVTAKADITTFVDGANTEDWAEDAMSWAVAEKLINGIENNQLDPQGDATRAQMATILYRFCENVAK